MSKAMNISTDSLTDALEDMAAANRDLRPASARIDMSQTTHDRIVELIEFLQDNIRTAPAGAGIVSYVDALYGEGDDWTVGKEITELHRLLNRR